MAKEHGMIEPFEEKLVRTNGQQAPVISYGLSSYGYDLRVAHEFKVFTNVYNAVVDPKAFDDRSFVDISGEAIRRATSLELANCQFRVYDGVELPHPSGQFDLAIAIEVIEHVELSNHQP